MARELKFRAWADDIEIMISPVDLSSPLQEYKWLGRKDYPIMQYTGFKDKHGEEIYEGDILEIKLLESGRSGMPRVVHGNDVYHTVTFENGAFVTRKDKDSDPVTLRDTFSMIADGDSDTGLRIMVVGNIYQMPK